MAKVVGLVGSASGKIGNIVYAVTSGIQVARVYQPNVSNPKSVLQNRQRAKGNLVGRLSSVIPWQVLVGLGSSKRDCRAKFLKNCLSLATINVVNNEYRAKLSNEDLIFSHGPATAAIGARNLNADQTAVTLEVTRLTGVPDDKFAASGSLVIVVLSSTNGQVKEVFYRYVLPTDLTGGTLSISFSHISEGQYYADLYVAPFVTEDGAEMSVLFNRLFGSVDGPEATTIANASNLPIKWGDSYLAGSSAYTPA